MMIMEDSKMYKIEYDLKAVMYSLGASGEPGHPCSILFSREGGSQCEGCIDPDAGISRCADRMAKHAFQAHFDGKIYQ